MFLKIIKRFVLPAILFSIGLLIFANKIAKRAATQKTFSDVKLIPKNKVGLLLGTSKRTRNGENLYFNYRIAAAVNLFRIKKIEFILISGDNSITTYDEPTDMQNALIATGIPPNKIVLDYAGFSTYESLARAKYVFSTSELTIISQKFHNERAIYLASALGIKSVGFNAQDVPKMYGYKTRLRERLARALALKDAWFKPKPKFLGKKIKIG